MFKNSLLVCALVALTFAGCKKDDDDDDAPVVTPVTSAQVLNDFANTLAIPNYADLKTKCNALKLASFELSVNTTDQNLTIAKDAWRGARQAWEQAEGFLIGPVQDFDYDPATDSWPVNTTELEDLLNDMSNPLELANVDSLQFTLKGYHPIEFVLFGVGGTRTASQLTARELKYLTSLSESLYNTVADLVDSWDVNQSGNFTAEILNAGNTNLSRYSSKKDVFLAIVNAMAHICDEVANNKMEVPLVAHDSELVESQYAHNATTDFSNNITGVQNVYLCKYTTTGKSLHDLVKEKNLSLDNEIQTKINNAIASLSVINPNYGEAIFNQQIQILNAQLAINDLVTSLNLLTNFVHTNITD